MARNAGLISADVHAFTHTEPADGEAGVVEGKLVLNNVAGQAAAAGSDLFLVDPQCPQHGSGMLRIA